MNWSQFSLRFSKKHPKMFIIGFMYRPPCIHLKEFYDLTKRPTKENDKGVILWSDFSIDLVESKSNTSEFLDVIYSSNLLPENYINSIFSKLNTNLRPLLFALMLMISVRAYPISAVLISKL